MSNNLKYYIRNALYASSLFFVSGSILQTFLNEAGLSAAEIGLYVSMSSAVGVLATVLLARLPDRRGRIGPSLIRFTLLAALCSALFIPFCFFREPAPLFVALVFLLGGVQNLVMSLKNLYEYKLPYSIVRVEEYGSMLAIDGVVSGVVGIFPGIVLSLFLKSNPFFSVMGTAFLIAAVLAVCSAAVTSRFRFLPPKSAGSASAVGENLTTKQVLCHPLFRALLPANFLRGAIYGAVSIAAVIGLREAGFDGPSSALIPIAAITANITGSFLYILLTKRFKAYTICLAAGVLTAAYPLCCLGGVPLFLTAYFLTCLGIMFLNCAVPYIIYQIVPYEIAGAYNNWRMAITNGISALTAAVCGRLIGQVPAWSFLAVAAVCQLLSSVMYYIFSRNYFRQKKEEATLSR